MKSFRDMVVHYVKFGLSVEEIAERLGVGEEKVMQVVAEPEIYELYKETQKRRERSSFAPVSPEVKEAELAGLIELQEIMLETGSRNYQEEFEEGPGEDIEEE